MSQHELGGGGAEKPGSKPGSDPLISIITPAFNAEAYISETIESVLAQTLTDWEMLIADDGSTDGTAQIVSSYSELDSRVHLIPTKGNEGAGPARNRGLAVARGRYIAFLDADDLWLPKKLERQLSFMKDLNSYFSYTAYDMLTEQASETLRTVYVATTKSYKDLLANTNIGCLTVMVDTSKTGPLCMPSIPVRQPLVLWLQLLRTCGDAHGLNEVLARYRVRPGSISRDKRRAALGVWRVYREYEKLPLPHAAFFFLQYAIRGIARNR